VNFPSSYPLCETQRLALQRSYLLFLHTVQHSRCTAHWTVLLKQILQSHLSKRNEINSVFICTCAHIICIHFVDVILQKKLLCQSDSFDYKNALMHKPWWNSAIFVSLVLYLFLDIARDVDVRCRHTLSVRDTFRLVDYPLTYFSHITKVYSISSRCATRWRL